MPEIVVERWTPVVEVYGKRRPPAHGTFALDLFTDKALKAANAWPGQKANIRVIELNNDAFFYQEALPGESPFKARLLALDYDLIFRDAGATRWIPVETAREKEERAEAAAHFQEIIDDLEGETDRSDEQNRQLAGARDALAQLGLNREGFLNTFRNLYDSGAEGIIWDLSVANVPIDLISKDDIGQDRSVSFRMLRASPLPEQDSQHNLIYKFTNGNTQYALVFGRNNSVQWWHYRNMTGPKRRALEKELETLEESGRLTAADNEQLQAWNDDIDDIREAAKLDGRASNGLNSNEKAAIKAIQENIRDLKASKRGLSAEDEKNRAEILKRLFYDRANVNLQEDTKSLYDRIFDVTVRFLRKGQVQVQLDKNPPWTWTNAAIAKLRGYNQMLPANSRVIIHNDGGSFGVALGRPRHRRNGRLWSAEFVPGYEFAFENLRWEFDADFVETEYDGETGIFTGLGPFGTRVEAKVVITQEPTTKGGIYKPPRYQLQIELFSDEDGVYSPEIHHIHFRVLAGEVPDRGAAAWESNPGNVTNPRRQPVQDITSQDGEDKTPHFEIKIDNKFGEQDAKGLPQDLNGREVVVKLIRVSDGVTTTMISGGTIKRAEHPGVRLLDTVAGWLKLKRGSLAKNILHVVGLEEVLNRDIRFPIHGNGKFPNDYIRELCQNAGLRDEEYDGIPAGDIGIDRLQAPLPGEPPDIQAEPTARYWEYLQDFVGKHCRGYRLVVRAATLVLEPDTVRDRPDLDYRTTRPSWDILHIKKGFSVYQDADEFYTEAVFTGAVDPQTGKRWAATKSIPEATDPRFEGKSMYYVGLPKIYIAPIDGSLQDYEACVLAARAFMDKAGRPPWYCTLGVSYNPSVRCGDLIRVDGLRAVVENIQRGTLKPGKGDIPKMTLVCRFFEDYAIGEAA